MNGEKRTMCDEREQLIEYVYGEAATAERQRIDAHLAECHVCRAEVAGLRSVRDDLLAWEVPRHEPVWRPFVPVPVAPVRRPVSLWSLAAAASVVFAAGLAGGMAARAWIPGPTASAPVVQAGVAPEAAARPQAVSTVTPQDLAKLEADILQRVRGELTERIRAATPQAESGGSTARVGMWNRPDDVTEARLAAIEQWMDDQISLNAAFSGQFGRLNSRTSSLSEQIELSRMQRVTLETGAR
jgi:hypothetical protein